MEKDQHLSYTSNILYIALFKCVCIGINKVVGFYC